MAEPTTRQMPTSRLFLPMVPKARAIDPEWKCQQSGDCCTKPEEVHMTTQEAALLVHKAPAEIKMQFRPVSEGFVAMKAGPCPLFVFNGCLVYSDRPYNCRRFACMRPDPKAEPWETDSEFGCKNFTDRFKASREVRRLAVKIQRKAQRWALSHGWTS